MVLAELGGKLRDSLRKLHHGASGGSAGSDADNTKEQFAALLSEITRALIEADVNVKLVMQLRDNIKTKVEPMLLDLVAQQGSSSSGENDGGENKPSSRYMQSKRNQLCKLVQRAVIDELVALLTVDKKPYVMRRGRSNVVMFVGLQGAGKTTTIAKFAHHYQRKGWKIAMVCADTFRAGAFDQLKQNATKLRIPFYGSYTEPDPVAIAEAGVSQFRDSKYELIIVDTSGRHRQETALFEEMQEISAAVQPNNTVLVMDATQGQAVYDQALAFHDAVPVGSVIVTKLDGHAKGGGALSAVAATQSPIIFLGSGEHFDDLDAFHPQSFVSQMLGFGDMRGLMEAMKDSDQAGSKDELMEKMSKGEFTLRDMYNQFTKVMNLGPLNKLMGMMPGMPEYLVPKGGDQESTNRLRKFMVMMDSMTDAELDGKVNLNNSDIDPATESRIRRIAAGSGCGHPNEVKMLLLVHKQFEGMVQKMGKSGMMSKGMQAKQQQMAAQMRRNPNLINQRLNQMDPKTLQQMGGREHVMQMMQQYTQQQGAGGAAANMMGSNPMMEAMMGGAGGAGGGGMMGMPPGAGMMPPGAGGAGGGMPGGLPPGMDMEQLMKMAQAMGMGGGGGGGGFPPGSMGGR